MAGPVPTCVASDGDDDSDRHDACGFGTLAGCEHAWRVLAEKEDGKEEAVWAVWRKEERGPTGRGRCAARPRGTAFHQELQCGEGVQGVQDADEELYPVGQEAAKAQADLVAVRYAAVRDRGPAIAQRQAKWAAQLETGAPLGTIYTREQCVPTAAAKYAVYPTPGCADSGHQNGAIQRNV